MKTAVIYTRVSSKEQVSGTSLDTQLTECRRFADRAGYIVEGVFTDAGLSAKTAEDRPQLQAAIRHCVKHHTSAFLVWKVDRLSRNTADGIAIREMLRRVGCEVVSATEGFTADPLGDAMSSILLTFAQLDNAQRAIRCRTGMEETALRGGWCHKAPEGFDRTKTADGLPILVPNATGQALQIILKNYAAGRISKTEYYSECQKIGINAKKAERIPHRDIYAGIIRETLTGGQPVKAAFPGLITPKELSAIRQKATTLSRRNKPTSDRQEAIYKGLIKCECGRSLSPYKSKGHLYYKCSECGKPNIRAEKAYTLIAEEIKKADYLSDLLKAATVYARHAVKREIENRRKLYAVQESEARKATARLNRLTDLYLDGKISETIYTTKSSELQATIARSNHEKTDVQVSINEQVSALERVAKLLENPKTFIDALPPDRAHAVLEYIFGSFVLTPEKTLMPKSNPEKPSLHTLLQSLTPSNKTKSGEPSPAASSLASNPSFMVEVRRVELLTF